MTKTFTDDPVRTVHLSTDRREGFTAAVRVLRDRGLNARLAESARRHDQDGGWDANLSVDPPMTMAALARVMEEAGFEFLMETTFGFDKDAERGLSAYWSSLRCTVCGMGATSAWKVKGGESFPYCEDPAHEAQAKAKAQGVAAAGKSEMAETFGADGRWTRRGKGDGAWTRRAGLRVIYATQTKANEITVQVMTTTARTEDLPMRGRLASPRAALLYGNAYAETV